MNNGQNGQSLGDAIVFDHNQDINVPNILEAYAHPTSEHDNRNIGNKAIFSNEIQATNSIEMSPQNPENLGVVTEIEPQQLSPTAEQVATQAIDMKLIRTEGDHIAKSAIKEIQRAENELDQTGNISKFYDKARQMMLENLRNSYERELAA